MIQPRRHQNIGDDWKWFAGGLIAIGGCLGAALGALGMFVWDHLVHQYRGTLR